MTQLRSSQKCILHNPASRHGDGMYAEVALLAGKSTLGKIALRRVLISGWVSDRDRLSQRP